MATKEELLLAFVVCFMKKPPVDREDPVFKATSQALRDGFGKGKANFPGLMAIPDAEDMVVTSYEGDEDDARRLIAIHRALAAWMGSDDARGANALEWEEVATHLKPPHNSLAETDLAEHEIDGLMGHASTFGFTYHSSARTGVNPATDDPIATAARAALEQYRRQVADWALPDATQDPATPLDISRLILRVEGGSLPEVIPLHPPGSPEAALA